MPSRKPKEQVEGGFLLHIVTREGSAVLELFAGKSNAGEEERSSEVASHTSLFLLFSLT